MLISKHIAIGDVVTVKLVTGDELVAKLHAVTADTISISKPMLVSLGMDERTRQVGIQMSPYFVLCGDPDAPLTLKNPHILVYTLANDAAKQGYIQNTTGFTIASSVKGNGLIT